MAATKARVGDTAAAASQAREGKEGKVVAARMGRVVASTAVPTAVSTLSCLTLTVSTKSYQLLKSEAESCK